MNYDRCEDDGFIIRGRAISKLELMRCNSEWNEDFNKALDLAIKVLRQTGSDDLISRQQAIEEIKNATTITGWNEYASQEEIVDDVERQLRRLFVGVIESLPQVIPTERTGEWIDDCTCSNCNWLNEDDDGRILLTTYNYCPNCGAKMKGENNE